MNKSERAKRLAEREGIEPGTKPSLKPRPPAWLLHKILENCGGQPDPTLSDWLASRQVFAHDIAQWRAGLQHSHWQDPNAVMACGVALRDHPMRMLLGRWLGRWVRDHAPYNQKYLPPDLIIQETT